MSNSQEKNNNLGHSWRTFRTVSFVFFLIIMIFSIVPMVKKYNLALGATENSALVDTTKRPPQEPLAVIIGDGSEKTGSRYVDLKLEYGSDVANIAISNTPDFAYSSIEPVKSAASWDLCAFKDGVKSPVSCPEGTYTVYVRYFTTGNYMTKDVFDSIVFTTVSPTPNYKLSVDAHRIDLNFDDKIDMKEFGFLQQNWGKTGINAADFNNDKVVDIKDLNILMRYWTN